MRVTATSPRASIDARSLLGTHDIALITLDTLRYDVAERALAAGRTPHLARLLGDGKWELRHAPGSFTYASHHAMFAGFLPTPARPGRHERLFALSFQGSETIGERTAILDGADIVSGLRARGYHTVCIGGVGFFNLENPLGRVLPGLFEERHFHPSLGVTDPRSTEHQVALAASILDGTPRDQRVFLFVNVSALHQPNRHYVPGAERDSVETQEAALAYVDRSLPPLFEALARRGPSLVIVCSDHGTAYGEDGYHGHRLAHEVVWNVPYAEHILAAAAVGGAT